MAGSARALRLVPAALYDRMLAEHLKRESDKGGDQLSTSGANERSAVTNRPAQKGELVLDEGEEVEMEKKELIDAVVDLLPRQYKRKGRILLQTADINLQRNSLRIIYPGDPPELGSHIIDLLLFLLAPPMIRRRMKNRPYDIERFHQLLADNKAIPQSIIGSSRARKRRPQPEKEKKRRQPSVKRKAPSKSATKRPAVVSWLR